MRKITKIFIISSLPSIALLLVFGRAVFAGVNQKSVEGKVSCSMCAFNGFNASKQQTVKKTKKSGLTDKSDKAGISPLQVNTPKVNQSIKRKSLETDLNPESDKAAFSVEGMTCPLCAKGIEDALAAVEGVIDSKVSLEEEKVIVTFYRSKIDPGKLIDKINKAGGGYHAFLAKEAVASIPLEADNDLEN